MPVSDRGPKLKTRLNGPKSPRVAIDVNAIDPTSPLGSNALVEFRRLLSVLDSQGRIESVDLGLVTGAAMAKDDRDRLQDQHDKGVIEFADYVRLKSTIDNDIRGFMRQMGLVVQPSRIHVKFAGKTPQAPEPVSGLIKFHEESA